MRIARIARGDDPRWLWQARTAARCVGALAVRCVQRGERVHVAMLARGYDGRMPATGPRGAGAPAGVGRRARAARRGRRGDDRRAGVGVTDLRTVAPHEHVEVDEPPALLVVGHGSRDADGLEEFWALAAHDPRGGRASCRSASASSSWPSRWSTRASTSSSRAG